MQFKYIVWSLNNLELLDWPWTVAWILYQTILMEVNTEWPPVEKKKVIPYSPFFITKWFHKIQKAWFITRDSKCYYQISFNGLISSHVCMFCNSLCYNIKPCLCCVLFLQILRSKLCTVKHSFSKPAYNEFMLIVTLFKFPIVLTHIMNLLDKMNYVYNWIKIVYPQHFIKSVFYCTCIHIYITCITLH